MSTSTALKLLALLLASVARDARSARATPAPVRALAPMAVAAGAGDGVANALDACRARCGDEAFAPVCAANGAATYANKCWANCAFASGLLGSGARVNFVVDGACANPTRFRNPSFACATACAQVYRTRVRRERGFVLERVHRGVFRREIRARVVSRVSAGAMTFVITRRSRLRGLEADATA